MFAAVLCLAPLLSMTNVISLMQIIRLHLTRWLICFLISTHYGRWQPRMLIVNTRPPSVESFHPFIKFPLVRTVITILNCHTSVIFTSFHAFGPQKSYHIIIFGLFYERRSDSISVTQKAKVKVKVKLSLCFNWAPRHEGVLGKWRYSSTHSWPRH
jgi:hypothetical protein